MIKIFTTIWALCLSIGLFAQENQRMFFAYDASNGLADNSAQIVLCTKTGRLVISTIGHINFYDGASFTHVDPSPGDAKVLPGYDGRYQMYFDSFHHLWIKHHRQLTCVDLLKERFISNIDSVLVALGTSKHLDDLYGDGESNVWFRTGDMVGCPSLKKQFRLHHKSSVQDLDLYNDSLILMVQFLSMTISTETTSIRTMLLTEGRSSVSFSLLSYVLLVIAIIIYTTESMLLSCCVMISINANGQNYWKAHS